MTPPTCQERDPRAYQALLRLPSGATFLSSTPEQLFRQCGSAIVTEAVAGTRPRGPPGDPAPPYIVVLLIFDFHL